MADEATRLSARRPTAMLRSAMFGGPLGSDPEAAVIARYGSWVEKKLYGREYMGIDRSTFLIQDGVIQRIWRKVKVAGHAQDVLNAVKAL